MTYRTGNRICKRIVLTTMIEDQYIPRIVILLGLIIHAVAAYLLPWIGYGGAASLNIVSIIGMVMMLVGVVLLFYFD